MVKAVKALRAKSAFCYLLTKLRKTVNTIQFHFSDFFFFFPKLHWLGKHLNHLNRAWNLFSMEH